MKRCQRLYNRSAKFLADCKNFPLLIFTVFFTYLFKFIHILDVTATPPNTDTSSFKTKSSNNTTTNITTSTTAKESEANAPPVVDALSKAINAATNSGKHSSESQTTSDTKPAINATTNSAAPTASSEPQKYDDDDIHLGEKVYKEEIANGDVVKYVYRADAPIANVTLKSAINAGKFDDKGKVDSMEDCVKICGETSDCDVAFMLSSQCFNVHCHSDETCQTKPAFSSFYNPQLSYIKHRSIKKHKKESEGMLL